MCDAFACSESRVVYMKRLCARRRCPARSPVHSKACLNPKLMNRSLMNRSLRLSAQMREINLYLPAIKVPLPRSLSLSIFPAVKVPCH
jgi:hypothetical protein